MTADAAPPDDDSCIDAGRQRLRALMARGAAFLGSEHAILCGAMTWVSERNLVAAISNAGGFGVLACGAMEPDRLDEEIRATRTLTENPFAVNLITLHPALEDLVALCCAHGLTHVVLAGGIPPGWAIDRLKADGIKVMCFAPAYALAHKLIRSGVDALIIEGSEAGGHIGPVSTSVLAQEILPRVTEVPVFIAGGIGRGAAIAAYLEMGAAGVQLGTRFVCATESIAHPAFKKAFIRSPARDAVTSVQLDPRFPVIPVRGLRNEGTKRFLDVQRELIDKVDRGEMDQKTAGLEIEHFWAGALRRAVIDGDVETGSVMAGQSVGLVEKEQPAADIIQDMLDEAAAYLSARGAA